MPVPFDGVWDIQNLLTDPFLPSLFGQRAGVWEKQVEPVIFGEFRDTGGAQELFEDTDIFPRLGFREWCFAGIDIDAEDLQIVVESDPCVEALVLLKRVY